MDMYISQKKCRNSQAKNWAHCVQACAVEMHMDIAQNHFYVNIYSKDATPRRVCPDLAPALTLAVRTPYIPHDVPNVRHLRGRFQRPDGRSLRSGVTNATGQTKKTSAGTTLAVRTPYIPHDVPNVRHLRGRLQRPDGRSLRSGVTNATGQTKKTSAGTTTGGFS